MGRDAHWRCKTIARLTAKLTALAPSILWDVIEEHFDEIDYLFGSWNAARRSWRYTAIELVTELKARIWPHVDRFNQAGLEAYQRFVFPCLDVLVSARQLHRTHGVKRPSFCLLCLTTARCLFRRSVEWPVLKALERLTCRLRLHWRRQNRDLLNMYYKIHGDASP